MADTFARMRQIYGTTADWTANNIVLQSGEMGVEVVSASDVRIKVGDGVSTFSALPYAASSTTTINAATQAALDAKLALAGGTMTGLLVLSGDPSAALGATTKQYVDNAVTSLSTSLSGKLNVTGGTLNGFLTLSADPTSALHAASKQYVDSGDSLKVSKSGDTMTGALVLAADPANAMEAATKQYVDSGTYQSTVGGSSAYAGKVPRLNASGVLDSSMVPPAASYLGTVNLLASYALTGTFTAGNYYSVINGGTIDASWNTKLNGSPSTCSAGQFIYYNINGKWDLVGDTASATAINGKVNKSGDTMTGQLILAANPTVALGAVPKQYADAIAAAALPLAGGTMTGAITLPGAPSAANNAATKAYVDAAIPPVSFGFRNKLINGTLDIWQRGTQQTTTGYGSADKWAWNYGSGGTYFVTRILSNGDTSLPEGALFYAQISHTVAPSTPYSWVNRIESVRTLAGKTATLSFYTRRNSGVNEIRPYLTQRFGTGGSPSAEVIVTAANVVPTASWARYSVTFTVASTAGKTLGTNGDDHLEVGLTFMTSGGAGGVGINDVAWIMLEEGGSAGPPDRRPISTELILCQRYYQKSYSQNVNPGTITPAGCVTLEGVNTGSRPSFLGINQRLPVVMRATPTVTYYSPFNSSAGFIGGFASGYFSSSSFTNGSSGNSEAAISAQFNNVSADGIYFHYTASADL